MKDISFVKLKDVQLCCKENKMIKLFLSIFYSEVQQVIPKNLCDYSILSILFKSPILI